MAVLAKENKAPEPPTLPLSFNIFADRETGAFGYTHNIHAGQDSIQDINILIEILSHLDKELNKVLTETKITQALAEKDEKEAVVDKAETQ